ncbi:hypothetical protein NQ314_011047 [Rhamnusium bicolor]|uniref:Uncharacterized protein n=1 Tax=Rhamnusium bicolor TaxID=1586634 RepID=A0AAV8XM39_9CUCU|nr:hypothetical protein NQ314_011047 [Rhamnusium bicolor]
MCPPKLCKCPKPTNRLLVLLAFVAKAAIASTTMWVTYDIGIWGTTEDTHQMYKNYCTLAGGGSFQRATKWDPPSCEAEKDLFKVTKKF